MGKKLPIFYNVLLLTGVNLLLRFVSTSFQVYLSRKIGATGIGLLQMVLSVGTLAMTVSMGGIRTATMYLSAEIVGQKRTENMIWVLSGCITYSILLSTAVGTLVYWYAPWIATKWIEDVVSIHSVRLLAAFLPVNCLCGVMVGHFTGINKIGTLAIIEIFEQLLSMIITITLLIFWEGSNTYRACLSVIFGSGFGACFTLITLLLLKKRERCKKGTPISVKKRLWETAIPLAIADNVKAIINTTENLMVPKRLSLYPTSYNPLAEFGMVYGMVFPVLMFPAAILFGLAELLIPEMARCSAAGSTARIKHLAEKSFLITMVYGCMCGGILYLSADMLCIRLYKTPDAGRYLRWFAILVPMLYCDIIVDAMTKGLGQQKNCVRNNIITSTLDVILLFLLLPRYGMNGYFFSFLITHLLNFGLSIQLLLGIVKEFVSFHRIVFSLLSVILAVFIAMKFPPQFHCILFIISFTVLLFLLGVIDRNDLDWICSLIQNERRKSTLQ